MKKVFLLLILIFFSCDIVQAAQKLSVEDRLISSTFKALAKGFVTIADINKLKQDNIEKLIKMDEGKFRKRYAKVYAVIKDLPLELKSEFKITEDLSKEQAVRNIESLKKQKLYEIIEAIPDRMIVGQFRQYLKEKKERLQKSNLVSQISNFWSKILPPAK